MIVIGLTGSIGMGKTTVGSMLQKLGIPVHEADEAVHELLAPGGKGVQAVTAAFPYYEYEQIYSPKNKQGMRNIDREKLGDLVFHDDEEREKLESILHPLVHEMQREFIKKHKALGQNIVTLDIPLLFETGGENRVDYTINVSAPFHVQQSRVLDRPGMNEEKFTAILKRQMPDEEKNARADFVVHTGLSRGETMKEVKAVLREIKNKG